jgi:hypothetical protein
VSVRVRGLAVAAVVGAAATAGAGPGCRPSPPPLGDCRDALSGVWRAAPADPPRAFDIRDGGQAIDVYAMWNTATPLPDARSPWRIRLSRLGTTITGTVSQRIDVADRRCVISRPARISACQGQTAIFELSLARRIDATTCALREAPERLVYRLRRD